MASGLFALLDDIAALTKLTAASLDDVGAAAAKASAKAAGVVIDDTAVTPRYVAGLAPQRELPIVGRIALGSLRNKLLLLLPGALLLSAVAPWSLTPLLMIGGAFLCFEGAEKVIEAATGKPDRTADEPDVAVDPAAIEDRTVKGAVRTDLILSAEIMAIALADVAASPLVTRAIVLAIVALGITVGVYGVVALIVKLDDIGLHLATKRPAPVRAIGRALVLGMPIATRALTVIGTAAMIWVGGGILLHGLEALGVAAPAAIVHHAAEAAAAAAPELRAAAAWLVGAAGAGLFGLTIGGVIAAVLHIVPQKAAH